MLFANKATAIEYYNAAARDGNGVLYEIPSVLVSQLYRSMYTKAQWSKKNILYRDMYTCQYCGVQNRTMTVDHIIPISKFKNGNTFENTVACCFHCNRNKANKTISQAKMSLIRTPKQVSRIEIIRNKILLSQNHESWQKYLK